MRCGGSPSGPGSQAPLVFAITPGDGPAKGGTSVHISGSNFAAGATVTIGGAAATDVDLSKYTGKVVLTLRGHADKLELEMLRDFARVGIDYHVEVAGFFYSVPHALIREQVDTHATQRTIEVFHRGKRVAAHARRYGGPRHGTQSEHMPSAHRRYAEWTPERLQRDARGIGRVAADFMLNLIAYNLIRIPKLIAA